MEKMIWEKPEMNDIAFGASEYVAACGDSGNEYYFDCNAPAGFILGRNLYYYSDAKVEKDATVPTVWNPDNAVNLGGYTPCGKEHTTPTSDDYYWGFVDSDFNGAHQYEEEEVDVPVLGTITKPAETVIVWLERDEDGKIFNWHATPNLDINSWAVTYSG